MKTSSVIKADIDIKYRRKTIVIMAILLVSVLLISVIPELEAETSDGYGIDLERTSSENSEALGIYTATDEGALVEGKVAAIGNNTYDTIEEAFGTVQDGQTITLLGDCTVSEKITIESKAIIFNLNGKTVTANKQIQINSGASVTINDTANGAIEGTVNQMINNNGGTLTINGGSFSTTSSMTVRTSNGTFIMTGGTISGGATYGLFIAGGTATITGGSIQVDDRDYAVYSSSKNLIIGTEGSDDGPAISSVRPSKTFTYYSGSIGTLMADLDSVDNIFGTFGSDISSHLPAGYHCVQGTDGRYSIEELTQSDAAASIDGTLYSTLEAAGQAVQDGQTIVVLNEYEEDYPFRVQAYNVTIDLNGHVIKVNGEGEYGISVYPAYGVDYDDSKPNSVTIRNGTVVADIPVYAKSGGSMYVNLVIGDGLTLTPGEGQPDILLDQEAHVELTDISRTYTIGGYLAIDSEGKEFVYGRVSEAMEVDADKSVELLHNSYSAITMNVSEEWNVDLNGWTVDVTDDGIRVGASNASLTVSNGTVISSGIGAIVWNSSSSAEGQDTNMSLTLNNVGITSGDDFAVYAHGNNKGTDITINGGSVTATDGWGVYFPSTGTVSISNAEISGITGIEMRAGSLSIVDTKIAATATEYTVSEAPKDGGSTVLGAAIAIAPYSNSVTGGSVSVDIQGGTFTGQVAFAQVHVPNVSDTPTFNFSISGGKFTSNDPTYDSVVTESGEIEERFITGGSFPSGIDETIIDTDYTLNDDNEVVLEDQSTAVAQIVGGQQFTSLADAIAAAQDGQTVALLQDIEIADGRIDIERAITLDLTGKQLSITSASTAMFISATDKTVEFTDSVGGGKIYFDNSRTHIVISAGTLKLNGTTMESDTEQASPIMIRVGSGTGTDGVGLIVTEGTSLNYTGPNTSYGMTFIGVFDDIAPLSVEFAGDISSSTPQTINAGIYVNGTVDGSPYVPSITVTGGSIDGGDAMAIYGAGFADYTITGGNLKGTSAVEVRAGNLTISGEPRFEATGQFSVDSNGNGSTTHGVAVGISQHTTDAAITVDISGGTFVGDRSFYQATPETGNDPSKIKLNISNGRFEGAVGAEDITGFISGGSFTTAVDEYLEPGLELVENSDGTYSPQTVVLALTEQTVTMFVGGGTYAIETSGDYVWTGLGYASSDPSVATVADGVITAVGQGTATVTVSFDTQEVTIEVTVENYSVGNDMTLQPITGTDMADIQDMIESVTDVPKSALESEDAFILDITASSGSTSDTYTISLAFSYFGEGIDADSSAGYTFYGIHFTGDSYEILESEVVSEGVQFVVDSFSPFLFTCLPNSKVPVEVSVLVQPKNATVTITDADGGLVATAANGETVELVPGDYVARAVADGYEVDPVPFTVPVTTVPQTLTIVMTAVEPDDPGVINPPIFDDDDDYVPPIYVPSDTSSSNDDTVKIVACAAAAVVAAIMAAFLILGHRRE